MYVCIVYSALDRLGMQFEKEHIVECGYSVDAAMLDDRLAIKVDGPSHFVREGHRLLGATQLKHRHLMKSNWRVISITYWDWIKLKTTKQQEAFLKDRINKA